MWRLFELEQYRLLKQKRIWISSLIVVITFMMVGVGFKNMSRTEEVDTRFQLQNVLNLIEGSQDESHTELQANLEGRYAEIQHAKQSKIELLKYQQKDIQRYFTTGSYVTDISGDELPLQKQLDNYTNNRLRLYSVLSKRKLNYESVRYGYNSVTLLMSILPILTSGIGILLFILIFALPQLRDLTTGKLSWLETLPLRRHSSFNAQLLCFSANTFVFLILLAFILFCFGGILGGFASLRYPVLAYWQNSTKIIPAFLVILLSLLLFWINLIFVYLLIRLVIAILKPLTNRVVLSFMIGGFIVIGLLLFARTSNPVNQEIGAFSPFSYLQSSQLLYATSYETQAWVNGNTIFSTLGAIEFFSVPYENNTYFLNRTIAKLQNNSSITIQLGLLVNSVATIVTYFFARSAYCRKLN